MAHFSVENLYHLESYYCDMQLASKWFRRIACRGQSDICLLYTSDAADE